MSETEINSTPEEQGEKRGAGRPPVEWTPEQEEMIRRLAEIHCTKKEIAHVMGVSIDTIYRKADELIAEGVSQGKVKLRRAQWRSAIDDGNVTMMIWLGKNLLGQSDSPTDEENTLILPWEQ